MTSDFDFQRGSANWLVGERWVGAEEKKTVWEPEQERAPTISEPEPLDGVWGEAPENQSPRPPGCFLPGPGGGGVRTPPSSSGFPPSGRVGLGTSVLVLPMRHPVPLAKELATLQNLSGGRLILGAGVGWLEPEYAALGVPFRERGRRMDEGLALMKALWSDDPVSFETAHIAAEIRDRNGRGELRLEWERYVATTALAMR